MNYTAHYHIGFACFICAAHGEDVAWIVIRTLIFLVVLAGLLAKVCPIEERAKEIVLKLLTASCVGVALGTFFLVLVGPLPILKLW